METVWQVGLCSGCRRRLLRRTTILAYYLQLQQLAQQAEQPMRGPEAHIKLKSTLR